MSDFVTFTTSNRTAVLDDLASAPRPLLMRIWPDGAAAALGSPVDLRVGSGRLLAADAGRVNGHEALVRVALARSGRLEVVPDQLPPGGFAIYPEFAAQMADAEAEADELAARIDALGGLSAVPVAQLSEVEAARLPDQPRTVAKLADGHLSTAQVFGDAPFDLRVTLSVLERLHVAGALEVRTLKSGQAPMRPPPAHVTWTGWDAPDGLVSPNSEADPVTIRERTPVDPDAGSTSAVEAPMSWPPARTSGGLGGSHGSQRGRREPAAPRTSAPPVIADPHAPSVAGDPRGSAESADPYERPTPIPTTRRSEAATPVPVIGSEPPTATLASEPAPAASSWALTPLPGEAEDEQHADDLALAAIGDQRPVLVALAIGAVAVIILGMWWRSAPSSKPLPVEPPPPVTPLVAAPIPVPTATVATPVEPPPRKVVRRRRPKYSLSNPPPVAGPGADVRLREAERLLRKGQLAEADTLLAELRRRMPRDAAVWVLSGMLEDQRGERAQAMRYVLRALRVNRRAYRAWVLKGWLEQDGREFASAVDSYGTALKVSPGHDMSPELRVVTQGLRAELN